MSALPEPRTEPAARGTHSHWERVQPELRAKIPDPFFRTFIQPLIASSGAQPEERELSLVVPDEKLLEHIKLRYIKIIEQSLRATDFRGEINLLPQKSLPVARSSADTETNRFTQEQTPGVDPAPALMDPTTDRPNARPGPGGYLVSSPAHPLTEQLLGLNFRGGLALVKGRNGYGKTTLGRDLVARGLGSNQSARYVSLEGFLTEFSLACQQKTAIAWRGEIRRQRLLVIDDFQFLKKGAGHSQEELRNLIDEYEERGHKLILLSDRPFEGLPLSDTLRSRFLSAFQVELPPPDFSARLNILKNEITALGGAVRSEDLMYLARNIAGDGRKLKSAAQRLFYNSSANGAAGLEERAEDPRRLESLCRDLFTVKIQIAPESVLTHVAEHFQTTPEAVAGPSRDKKHALARHLVACLCVDLCGLKFGATARLIGRKEHSCVVHARRKIAAMLEEDLFFRREVENLKSQILKAARHGD